MATTADELRDRAQRALQTSESALAGGKTDEAQVHATLAQAYATLLLYLKA